MRLYGEVFVSPIKAVSRRSREFWPRTIQFLTCASFIAHHLSTLCLNLLAGLSQDSPVEQQKQCVSVQIRTLWGWHSDVFLQVFEYVHECCCYDVHVCCVDSMAVSTVCIYVHVRLCLWFCLCRWTGPFACALFLCMCIVRASIHIVNICFFVCQVSPVLSWMGLFFNSRGAPIGPMVSRCDGTCCFGVNLRVDGACKLRGGVVHVPNISWASAVEYTVPCWSSPKSCKIQLLGSYPEKAAKAWRAWTWRKRQVFDWCVTLWLITNRSLPFRVLRLLCRQKLQMLSISKVSSLWWLLTYSSCCPPIIFSSGDMTTMTTTDVQETTTALLLGLASIYIYVYLSSFMEGSLVRNE